MPPLDRAIDVYNNDGLRGLTSKTGSLIKRKFAGGLSSRPRVESISIVFRPIYNAVFNLQNGPGIDVMEEDWDTLILLDACRYDDFERQNDLNGKLEDRLSQASDSPEFIKKNFAGKDLHDTVYVTANPHVSMIDDNVFFKIIDSPLSNWDNEMECVQPEEVTKAAIRAHEEYSNKRIIIHYMQPHDPPLGPTGNKLHEQIDLGGVNTTKQSDETRIFEAIADNKIEVEKARMAYRETLDIVLEEVEDLISEVDGRIVVSADHGEMFGEQPYPILGKLYEHYRHPHTVELCKIPWLIIDNKRRNINSDPPVEGNKQPSGSTDEQLKALGYK